MPYLAIHKTPLPDSNVGGDATRPLIRNVMVDKETLAVLCGGFVSNDNPKNAQSAVEQYVAALGGSVEDWDVRLVSLDIWKTVEAAIYQPLRDAAASAESTAMQNLRDVLAANVVRTNQLAGTDLVLRIPSNANDRRALFRALKLALEEAS